MKWLAASLAGLTLSCGAAVVEPADLVLLDGRIVTLEERAPEVAALAARAGRIVALGSTLEIRRLVGPDTRVIDLAGRLAVPGFIESHGHFTGIGASLQALDLSGTRSWDEILRRVADAAAETPPDEWILGWGWHQDEWDRPVEPAFEGFPTNGELDLVARDHPVLLKHAAGNHAGIANSRALALARIDRETADPPGGRIVRDGRGEPTGVLIERALDALLDAYERAGAARGPEEADRVVRRQLELANRECLTHGITSFQDAGSSFHTVDLMREAAEAGTLGVRLWVMLNADDAELAERLPGYRREQVADSRLTVRAIKRLIDGALGSHGAWLLEPYADLPESSGMNTLPLEQLEHTARLALEHHLQLCVHAIGDRGNREALDLFARVLGPQARARDLRWRIEHAQHLSPQDVPRFAELGVIASMQGVHCTSDAQWVAKRLGEERAARGAYVWRKLIDSGALVVNGTDAPIEDVDPIPNFYASVTRRDPAGRAFHPEQRMTRREALRSYTLDAARAAFEESQKGSLATGKLADVTVLSRDILTIPEEEILGAEVDYTIVGGKVWYERQS